MFNTVQQRIVLVVLVILLLAGCSQVPIIMPLTTSPTEVPKPKYTIDTNPVASGELVPKDIAQLAFVVYGQVESVNVEIGDVVQKGDALVQLETTLLNADISRAEYALAAAEAELKILQRRGADEQTRNAAVARIDIAKSDLESARYRLTQATLTAPFDGTIVDVQVMPGEVVTAGKVIITLADMRTMQVETLDLSETDLSRIYVGQPVQIHIEALDIDVDGVVRSIAWQATQLGENRVYKVIIKLSFQPEGLRWGMSVEIRFIGAE